MDKRSRLLSELRLLSRRSKGAMQATPSSSRSTHTAGSRMADLMQSDDWDLSELREELEAVSPRMEFNCEQSDFSGSDASDSGEDDSLDAHLGLLTARELEALGADALRSRQFADARRYFALARLEGAERCARSLAMGYVQLDRAAVLDDWVLAKYTEAAIEEGAYVERHVLEQQFEKLVGRSAKAPIATQIGNT